MRVTYSASRKKTDVMLKIIREEEVRSRMKKLLLVLIRNMKLPVKNSRL